MFWGKVYIARKADSLPSVPLPLHEIVNSTDVTRNVKKKVVDFEKQMFDVIDLSSDFPFP